MNYLMEHSHKCRKYGWLGDRAMEAFDHVVDDSEKPDSQKK